MNAEQIVAEFRAHLTKLSELPDGREREDVRDDAIGLVDRYPFILNDEARADGRIFPVALKKFVVGDTAYPDVAPVLASFDTELEAAQFIETLPEYETGRYSLDGPSDDEVPPPQLYTEFLDQVNGLWPDADVSVIEQEQRIYIALPLQVRNDPFYGGDIVLHKDAVLNCPVCKIELAGETPEIAQNAVTSHLEDHHRDAVKVVSGSFTFTIPVAATEDEIRQIIGDAEVQMVEPSEDLPDHCDTKNVDFHYEIEVVEP